VSAKDVVLAIIGRIGIGGGIGYAIEFAGSTIRALSMEGADRVQHGDRAARAPAWWPWMKRRSST
jgi:hypothetical protein